MNSVVHEKAASLKTLRAASSTASMACARYSNRFRNSSSVMRYSSLTLVSGNDLPELVVDDAVLVRIEVSDLQDLLDLVYARRIEHVQ